MRAVAIVARAPGMGELRVASRVSQPAAAAYQVGFSTYGGRPILADTNRAALFCRVLGHLRRRLGFSLHAYVLLPDRVRMILGALDDDPRSVRLITQQLRSRFAREVNVRRGRTGLVWQDGIDVIRLASPRHIIRHAHLLHRAPIFTRLTTEPQAWRWSSYRGWSGEGHPPIGIDLPEGVELPFTR
jgi:putative transposase